MSVRKYTRREEHTINFVLSIALVAIEQIPISQKSRIAAATQRRALDGLMDPIRRMIAASGTSEEICLLIARAQVILGVIDGEKVYSAQGVESPLLESKKPSE